VRQEIPPGLPGEKFLRFPHTFSRPTAHVRVNRQQLREQILNVIVPTPFGKVMKYQKKTNCHENALSNSHPMASCRWQFPTACAVALRRIPGASGNFQGRRNAFLAHHRPAGLPGRKPERVQTVRRRFDVKERVGKTKSVDLLFETLHFGGEVSAGVQANFGIEFGLCFGGNADFDLAFQPTVTLPDQYPFEVALPLTVSEGLLPDSHFTTTFPPLPKAYADLIFDMGAPAQGQSLCLRMLRRP
jgi:hypothetical protein